jgi:hypothetical protein
MADKKITECPKCGAKIDDDNVLYITQKMSTEVNGEMNANGEVTYVDDDAGYNDALEYIDGMLSEDGEPTILGCKHCI